MKTATLLHCAEPRLGDLDAGTARAEDRLTAFERCVDRALTDAADALLVAGHLLAPGGVDPALLARLEPALSRARAGGVSVITTGERGQLGWLEHLGRLELVQVLAAGGESAPLPAGEPRRDLVVFGLGRPRSRAELSRRLALLAEARRKSALSVALVHSEPGLWSAYEIAAAAAAAGYVALGSSPVALELSPTVRDPGPLTRANWEESDQAPSLLRIRARGKQIEVDAIPSGDRPLHVVTLDLDAIPGAVEDEFRRRLEALRPEPGALLRLDLAGQAPAGGVDEASLAAVAAEVVRPAAFRVRLPGRRHTAGGREAIEAMVLARLSATQPSPIAGVAPAIFTLLARGDEASCATAAGMVRSLIVDEGEDADAAR